jgi:hypothetical protein
MTVAEFLAWPGDGTGEWPEETEKIGRGGVLAFESIGFNFPLSEIYADTPLSDEDAN